LFFSFKLKTFFSEVAIHVQFKILLAGEILLFQTIWFNHLLII